MLCVVAWNSGPVAVVSPSGQQPFSEPAQPQPGQGDPPSSSYQCFADPDPK